MGSCQPFSRLDADGPACFGSDQVWTFGQVFAAGRELAAWLRARRSSGDLRVLLATENRLESAVALTGVWLAGLEAIVVPPTQRERIVAELRVSTDLVRGLLESTQRHSEGEAQWTGLSVQAEQVLAHLVTSGSTGRPVEHAKTAAQLFGEAEALAEIFSVDASSRLVPTVPVHHLYGLLFGVLLPWSRGAPLCVLPSSEPAAFHPLRLDHALGRSGATHLVTVPAHLRALLDARCALEPVGVIVSSAAQLQAAWAEAWERAGKRVVDVLGSTETGGIATRRPARDSFWTPLPGVRVLSARLGELSIESPFGASSSSAERGRLQSDGRFEYWGRADSVVKVGGKRVNLGALEAAAKNLEGVAEALALARPTDRLRGSDILLALELELRPADAARAEAPWLDKQTVRRRLRQQVDPLLVPRTIAFVARLPRNERGKVSREQALALFERSASRVAGLTELQRAYASAPPRVEVLVELSSSCPRFEGHFPRRPVMPAVAQLVDLVAPLVEELAAAPVDGWRQLKFVEPIVPASHLKVRVEADAAPGTFRFQVALLRPGQGELLATSGRARCGSSAGQARG